MHRPTKVEHNRARFSSSCNCFCFILDNSFMRGRQWQAHLCNCLLVKIIMHKCTCNCNTCNIKWKKFRFYFILKHVILGLINWIYICMNELWPLYIPKKIYYICMNVHTIFGLGWCQRKIRYVYKKLVHQWGCWFVFWALKFSLTLVSCESSTQLNYFKLDFFFWRS